MGKPLWLPYRGRHRGLPLRSPYEGCTQHLVQKKCKFLCYRYILKSYGISCPKQKNKQDEKNNYHFPDLAMVGPCQQRIILTFS
jgi:hypothetical protein